MNLKLFLKFILTSTLAFIFLSLIYFHCLFNITTGEPIFAKSEVLFQAVDFDFSYRSFYEDVLGGNRKIWLVDTPKNIQFIYCDEKYSKRLWDLKDSNKTFIIEFEILKLKYSTGYNKAKITKISPKKSKPILRK